MASLVAALVFGVAALLFGPGNPFQRFGAGKHSSSTVTLSAAERHFAIASEISASAEAVEPGELVPGETRYLWYSVRNRAPVPLTVTQLRITSVRAPKACGAENLDISGTTFTRTLPVPAADRAGDGSARVAVPIALKGAAGRNPGCLGATFRFRYDGSALVDVDSCSVAGRGPSPRPKFCTEAGS